MNYEQKLLLELLLKLDKFFRENNITYYLDGGTAIGAIRHNGFLPWDDDADIYVTRENYEKLLNVAYKLDDIGVVLGCYELYKDYSKTAAKFTDLNDTSFVKSDAFHGLAMGQNIDIFILDPVPKDKIEEYYRYFNVYSELLTYNYLVNINIMDNIDTYNEYVKILKKEGRDKTLERLKAKFTQYSEEESDYYVLRWGQIPMVYKKEIFGEPRMMEFEGNMLPVPNKVEDFLRTQFGDGWKYIPEFDNQITHDIYVDHDICGINYLEEFKKYINFSKAKQTLTKRKKYWIKRLPQQIKTNKEKFKFSDASFEAVLNDIWKIANCNILFKEKCFSELLNLINDIDKYRKDFSDAIGIYKRNKEILDNLIYVLAIGGKHFIADKYIKLMRITEEDGEKAIKNIKLCQLNHNLCVLMENREFEKAKQLINENSDYCSENIEFIRADVILRLKTDNPDYDLCEKLCDCGLKLFTNDGELMKLKGDIELKRGKEDNAIKLYNLAANNTRNGLVLLELKKKYGIENKL